MAILSAMQSAAIRLYGRKPATFFGAAGKFELEITDLVNEVAGDVARYQDWQVLTRFATITGDGETVDFDLPDDYERMAVAGAVQNKDAWAWGYAHIIDLNEFAAIRNGALAPIPGAWAIMSGKLSFLPAPTLGAQATYPYISRNWARDPQTGQNQACFKKDTDEFLLAEKLLTLGLVWRWRENKKLDAAGDQEAFIKALDEYAAPDRGSFVLRRNQSRHIPATYPAWPGILG